MKGELVRLVALDGEEDYGLLAVWSGSLMSSYSSGTQNPMTADQMRATLDGRASSYLMIRKLDDDRPIGMVNWETLAHPQSYTVGVAISDADLWGGGYGMDSMLVLLEYLFHTKNAHRVHIQAGVFNKQMMQLLTSGVIVVEGVLRDYYYLDGEYHDSVIGSILRDEYYRMMPTIGYPRDAVAAQEKREARELLAAHLTKHPVALRPIDDGDVCG
ncbi:GNAT family N-acetyltransferase [Salinispora pacifica]|uniref:GNAT family N-acetyltransferase n=1 Tax=Salinispora pacifica TaxID=351187 RepID=UPI00031B20B2|nr:GNAT family protein [Salinispora pacifica]